MTPAEALAAINAVRVGLTRLAQYDTSVQHELLMFSERLTPPLIVLTENKRMPPPTRTLILNQSDGGRLLLQARCFTDTDDQVIVGKADLETVLRETSGRGWTATWSHADPVAAPDADSDSDDRATLMAEIDRRIQAAMAEKAWLDAPALTALLDQKIARQVRVVAPPDSLLELVAQRADTAAQAAVAHATQDWGRVIRERFEDEFSTRLRQHRPMILDLIRGWLPGEIRATLRALFSESATISDDAE